MLYQFTYLFFRLKLIQPSAQTIDLWTRKRKLSFLENALINGNYKTRKLAAEALETIGTASTLPLLLYVIDDKIHNVSIAALNTLEHLDIEKKFITNVTRKRFNWVKEIREAEQKRKVKKDKKHNIYRWKRASKKSFDRVKEQLKKPIR